MENAEEKKQLTDLDILHIMECILFISGEPVYFEELSKLFGTDRERIISIAQAAEADSRAESRGFFMYVTESSVQLVSNKLYNDYVTEYMQPTQIKSFSQSLIETLAIVAYKQPITRSEIDAIRGIRSEYSVSQLIKQGFIAECGRKEVLGRPMLFCTTDKFLRKFGLHSINELPAFERFSELQELSEPSDSGETLDV